MKKVFLILAIVTLLCCMLAIPSFAAYERIDWGPQVILSAATYAKMDGDSSKTTVELQFEKVGYSYIDASRKSESASMTTTIQKSGFLWTWSDKAVVRSTLNSPGEYGMMGDYGSGTYRFLFTPSNNSHTEGGGIVIDPIQLKTFYSNSRTAD